MGALLRSAAAPAGGVRDRRADASGRRARWRGRGERGSSERGRPPRTGRSVTTRTGRLPTTPARRGGPTGERVLAEGRRLRELGLEPTLFCGGGWYTDADVAAACAELGYVDCTPRARRPSYLAPGEAWASLAEPARIRLPSGRLLAAIPTTHSLGDLARALSRPRSLPSLVHVYFHDTDLAGRAADAAVRALLILLGSHAGDRASSNRREQGLAKSPSSAPTAPRALRGTACARGSKLHGVSKAAPPAETPQPVPVPAPAGRDVRASRVYVLSRGPIVGLVRRALSVLALVALDVAGLALGHLPRTRHARARPRRGRHPLGAALERGPGRVAEVRCTDHGARVRSVGALPAAGAAARVRAHPVLPDRRRLDRAGVRHRHRLRLHDVRADPDRGARLRLDDRAAARVLRVRVARADARGWGSGDASSWSGRARPSPSCGTASRRPAAAWPTSSSEPSPRTAFPGCRLLGSRDELASVLEDVRPDEVILSEAHFDERTVLKIVEQAHRQGIKVRLAPDTTELLVQRGEYVPGHGRAALRATPAGPHRVGLGSQAHLRHRRQRRSSPCSSCRSGC